MVLEAAEGDTPAPGRVLDKAVPVWSVVVLAVRDGREVCPADGCGDSCRPVVECNGYTLAHLPNWDKSPLPRNDPANFAIFAARMAFSNRFSRSLPR